MTAALGATALLASLAAGGYLLRRESLRRRAQDRLGEAALGGPARARGESGLRAAAIVALAALAAGLLGLFLGWAHTIAAAAACDAGILAYLALGVRDARRRHRLEEQLAEAISQTGAALRAGLSLTEAVQRAAGQVARPLGPIFAEAAGRLRMGEDPAGAFAELTQRLPLDSVRLFALAVTVQWRGGGSLERSLASVGRYARDRVELARRIDSQSAPARSSVLTLVAATAAIAFMSWSNDPANLERFVASEGGQLLVAMALLGQGLSLLWMGRMSRVGP